MVFEYFISGLVGGLTALAGLIIIFTVLAAFIGSDKKDKDKD